MASSGWPNVNTALLAGFVIVMVGAELSIFTPMIGPAVAQLPALSQAWTEFVETFGLAVPAAMEAVSVMLDWAGLARPDAASLAVHVKVTVPVCQLESADGQETVGAMLSILTPVIGPAVAQLPTLSQTWTEFVETFELAVPTAIDAVSVTVDWAGLDRPEPGSFAVQLNVTVPLCQLESADGQDTVGARLSILTPVIGPAVAQLPALSQTWTEFVETFELAVPTAIDAVSVTVDWAGLDRPEPESLAVQVNVTVPVCQLESADGQETVGARLSILTPVIGPAVAQLPALSQTCTEFVEAFGLVVPAGADAVSVTLDWAGLARPETGSLAVQMNVTVPVCQLESAGGQDTVGAALSIFTPVIGPAVAQLPTLSQTWTEFVEAFGLVVPAGADAVSVTLAWAGLARPEPGSLAVHVKVTAPPCQLESAEVHETVGGALSIMKPVMAGIGVQLSTLSQSCPAAVEALDVEVPAGTEVDSVTLPVLDVPPEMPDSASVPVHVTVWSLPNQVAGATAGVHCMPLGAAESTFVVTKAVLVFPTKSVAASV